jgi:hypothetical protein
MNEWIVELKVKFEIWRSRGECKEGDLPMSEKVIPDIERTLSRALIGGACCSCGSGPPLVQRNIKGAHRAWEPMVTVPMVPPQKTLALLRLPLLRLSPPSYLRGHLLKVISK